LKTELDQNPVGRNQAARQPSCGAVFLPGPIASFIAQGMADHSQIEAVLDERHIVANQAFAHKDAEAYKNVFGVDLRYSQADGATIDRVRLMKDVRAQFKRLDRAESSFTRESLEVDGGEVRETLLQIAIAEASAFGFLRRIWRVERRGHYTWVIEDRQWKIVRVQVLSEKAEGRWKIGR
jgi:hypothetical protein